MDKTKKSQDSIKYELPIPEGVEVTLEGNRITLKGEKGSFSRNLAHPLVSLAKKENKIVLSTKSATKKNKRMINTFRAHFLNMFFGVQSSYVYTLKICSGHFPMTVKLEGDQVVVTNFLGEKVPRVSKVLEGVKVEVGKDSITIESVDLEAAGQTAVNLEVATKIKNRDRRVFQDGIYIVQKPKRVAQ
tara:strand:+ start:33081 stop:33644 length:564 start_codon:yes stop_codon:yes gene_type:complete